MNINFFYNEDCFITMGRMKNDSVHPDIILTSPPYNMTKRKGGDGDSGRYDVYKNDFLSEEDYIKFTINLFNDFNDIVKKNSRYHKVKSRNLSDSALDIVIELWTSNEDALINELNALDKVHSVSLMSHDGEVTF